MELAPAKEYLQATPPPEHDYALHKLRVMIDIAENLRFATAALEKISTQITFTANLVTQQECGASDVKEARCLCDQEDRHDPSCPFYKGGF